MTTREDPQAIKALQEIVGNKRAGPIMSRLLSDVRAAYDAIARERDLAVGRLQATEVQFYALRLELAESAIALKAAARERDALRGVVEAARARKASADAYIATMPRHDDALNTAYLVAINALRDAVRALDGEGAA